MTVPPTPADLDAFEILMVNTFKECARFPECVDELDPVEQAVGVTYRMMVYNTWGAYSEFDSGTLAEKLYDVVAAPRDAVIAELADALAAVTPDRDADGNYIALRHRFPTLSDAAQADYQRARARRYVEAPIIVTNPFREVAVSDFAFPSRVQDAQKPTDGGPEL